MEILYILLVILLFTRGCGEVAVRFGQPALVGELIGGILLGLIVHRFAGVFPVLSELTENEVFRALTDLGVFFLMLLAGMELSPKRLAKSSGPAFLIALGGMIIPLGVGLAMGYAFLPESSHRGIQALFLGTALAITAIPVAVKVLMELGKLESHAGTLIISAAVFDDVMGLFLLAVLTGLLQAGEWSGIGGMLWILGKVILFFAICSVIGLWILPRLARAMKRVWVEEFEFTAMLIVGLGFSLLAEAFHLHFILGAFLAGLFFTKRSFGTKVHKDVQQKTTAITTGFLAPIFFASIGLHLDMAAITQVPWFVLLLITAAIVSKFVGAGFIARAVGLSRQTAAGIGVAMSARGAVELIIADIALRAGLFDFPKPTPVIVENLFSATVIMAVATTLLMPIGLRYLLGTKGSKGSRDDSS